MPRTKIIECLACDHEMEVEITWDEFGYADFEPLDTCPACGESLNNGYLAPPEDFHSDG
jgi:hypothetical protein